MDSSDKNKKHPSSLFNIVIDYIVTMSYLCTQDSDYSMPNNWNPLYMIPYTDDYSYNSKLIKHWINHISTNSAYNIKSIFMKKIILKENEECEKKYWQNKKCISLDLFSEWDNWHKAIFVYDDNFLAQIICRCMMFSKESFKLKFDVLIKIIFRRVLSFSTQLKCLNSIDAHFNYELADNIKNSKINEDKKKIIENEIFIIVKYCSYLKSLGFNHLSFQITTSLLRDLFSIDCKVWADSTYIKTHPSSNIKTDKELLDMFKNKHICELKYNLLCLLLSIHINNEEINLALGLINNLDHVMNKKFEYYRTKNNYISLTELEQYEVLNVISFYKSKSQLLYILGKFSDSNENIKISNFLLKENINSYKLFHKYLLEKEIQFPSSLIKIFIECMIQNIHLNMIKNNICLCDTLFNLCFQILNKYFKNEKFIFSLVYIEYGEYLIYQKKFDYAEHALYTGEQLIQNTFFTYVCKLNTTCIHYEAAELVNVTNYYFAKARLLRCQILHILLHELNRELTISEIGHYYTSKIDWNLTSIKRFIDNLNPYNDWRLTDNEHSVYTFNNINTLYFQVKLNSDIGLILENIQGSHIEGIHTSYCILKEDIAFIKQLDEQLEKNIHLLNITQRNYGFNTLNTSNMYLSIAKIYFLKIQFLIIACSKKMDLLDAIKTINTMHFLELCKKTNDICTNHYYSKELNIHYLILAKTYLTTGLNIINSLYGSDHQYSATYYLYLGFITYIDCYLSDTNIYNKLKILVEAKNLLHKSENIINKYYPSNHYELKQIYKILSRLYFELAEFELKCADNSDDYKKYDSEENSNFYKDLHKERCNHYEKCDFYIDKYKTFPNLWGYFWDSEFNVSNYEHLVTSNPPCVLYCTKHCKDNNIMCKTKNINTVDVNEVFELLK